MGAVVAWEYAARHLDMVSCLVLLDASPDPPGETDAYVPGPQTPFGLRSPDEIIECAAARAGRRGGPEPSPPLAHPACSLVAGARVGPRIRRGAVRGSLLQRARVVEHSTDWRDISPDRLPDARRNPRNRDRGTESRRAADRAPPSRVARSCRIRVTSCTGRTSTPRSPRCGHNALDVRMDPLAAASGEGWREA